jgi:bla regulator protein BlaR1
MSAWLAESLAAFTLLLLLVLALRRPVAHFCGANWAYALWAIPALRLVLPPLPALPSDFAIPSVAIIPVTGGVTAPLPALAGGVLWVPLLLGIWTLGAVTFLVAHCLAYRTFLTRVASARPGNPPSYGGIDAVESEAVDGPLALGLLRRRIVLPADFGRRYSADERRFALEHELVHHRRGDIWWNVAALAILALNWFNPIAWLAHRAFRSDQELACDAAVAARISRAERHNYAAALVKSASAPGLVAACPMGRAGELKHRLRMMAGHRTNAARRAGGFATLLLLAGAGLASGAAGPVPLAPVSAEPVRTALVNAPSQPAPEMVAQKEIGTAPSPAKAKAAPVAAPEQKVETSVVAPVQLATVEPVPNPQPEAVEPPAPTQQRVTFARLSDHRVLVIRNAAALVHRPEVEHAIAQALAALEREQLLEAADAREALHNALKELREAQTLHQTLSPIRIQIIS